MTDDCAAYASGVSGNQSSSKWRHEMMCKHFRCRCMEEMATLGRFQCELVHQNGGGDSFHAVDGRAGGAAPEKGIITSNSQKTLVEVEDATFG